MEFRSRLNYLDRLPQREDIQSSLARPAEKILIVVDRKVAKRTDVRNWLKRFDFVYEVTAGEQLKDFASFPKYVKALTRLMGPVSRRVCVVAVGGGTVGDFAGFFASIFKRGVPFVQIPTTFVAAIDSAHGGKTGLNLDGVKNQIGTFYPAEAVLICRPLLENLPHEQLVAACGELMKMGLLSGGKLWDEIQAAPEMDFTNFWRLLPLAIETKYDIVSEDPTETTGIRQVLNLGHTLGHALETQYGLAHGLAVAHGLLFAVRWSLHRGDISSGSADTILQTLTRHIPLPSVEDFVRKYRRMRPQQLYRIISQDKKLLDAHAVQYVFVENAGKVRLRSVSLDSLVTEAQRQGWVSR